MRIAKFCRVSGVVLVQITLFVFLTSSPLQSIKRILAWIRSSSSSRSSVQRITLTTSELNALSTEINNTTSNHPIYKNFTIARTFEALQQVDVLLVVSSGPGHLYRRNAIRRTWWKECKLKPKTLISCYFITDLVNNQSKYFNTLQREQKTNKDILFQSLSGGVEFGYRYITHLLFAYKNFYFDYFLRLDDDMFFCLSEFVAQLPPLPLMQFHWGWLHCKAGVTRPEESIILFSYDVIEKFLSQNPQKLWCHPFADQMIALWLDNLNMGHILRHDNRIHHHPVVKDLPKLRDRRYVCSDYIAVHGSRPIDILRFWKNKGTIKPKTTYSIDELSTRCTERFMFDSSSLGYWKHTPKKCIDKPVWDTNRHRVKNGMYAGRLVN